MYFFWRLPDWTNPKAAGANRARRGRPVVEVLGGTARSALDGGRAVAAASGARTVEGGDVRKRVQGQVKDDGVDVGAARGPVAQRADAQVLVARSGRDSVRDAAVAADPGDLWWIAFPGVPARQASAMVVRPCRAAQRRGGALPAATVRAPWSAS